MSLFKKKMPNDQTVSAAAFQAIPPASKTGDDAEVDSMDIFDTESLSPWVLQYVNLIIEQAGWLDLGLDFKLEFMERIGLQVQRKIGHIVMDALDDDQLTELVKFKEEQPNVAPEAFQAWLKSRVPDIEKRIEDGLMEFAQRYTKRAWEERERIRQQAHQPSASAAPAI